MMSQNDVKITSNRRFSADVNVMWTNWYILDVFLLTSKIRENIDIYQTSYIAMFLVMKNEVEMTSIWLGIWNSLRDLSIIFVNDIIENQE